MSTPLYVQVVWDRPEFHGKGQRRRIDWPPSPVRLLGALISGAYALDAPARQVALQALERVSQTPAPLIYAPYAEVLDLPGTYTQRSGLDVPGGTGNLKVLREFLDLSLVEMDTASRTLKSMDGVALDFPTAVFEIRGDFTAEEVGALNAAAAEVGYFGRSLDPASLFVTKERPALLDRRDAAEDPTLGRLLPVPNTAGHTRGWTPGTIDWFDANHTRMFQGDSVSHLPLPPVSDVGFVQPLSYIAVQDHEDVATVPLTASVPNHRVPALMRALETSEIELPDGLVLFPLINAGHAHSDGRALGVGLSPTTPGSVTDTDLRTAAAQVGAALLQPDLLRHQSSATPQEGAWTVNPRRWQQKATRWVSATPYRGFPDQFVVAHQVRAELWERFQVEPVSLRVSSQPAHGWQQEWGQRSFEDGLTNWWLEIEMAQPLGGPLLLRDAQQLGTGLFVPAADVQDLQEVAA